jgi:xylan 1,4-beta-xylosidase
MGPWIADTIRQCDGKVDILAYWTFSDVFEEQGVVKNPFYGGFGLVAAGGIEKPAYNAFRLLHLLGDTRLFVDSDSLVATRRPDGTLVLAAWNLVPPGQSGPDRTLSLKFQNISRNAKVSIQRVDASHGDTLSAFMKMENPKYPTKEQVDQLKAVAAPAKPEKTKLKDGGLSITIPAHGLALIEIK